MKVSFTILGEAASKSNSRELVLMGKKGEKKRPALIKSEKAREYEVAAQRQIPDSARVMMMGPVRVTMTVYYASERSDLDESVILDVMQAKLSKIEEGVQRRVERLGVFVNDRQVREKHIFHGIDKVNPRAVIEVEQLHPEAALFEDLPIPVAPRKRATRPPVAERRELPPPVPAGVDPF